MNSRTLIFIGLIACVSRAGATETTPAPAPAIASGPASAAVPAGPLLKRIPDFTTWRISFYYSKDKEKSSEENPVDYGMGPDADFLPAPPRHITLTRTKPRYLAVTVDVKGNVLEQSTDGFQEFLVNPKSGNTMGVFRDPSTALRVCDFSKVDFPDLEWISKETFKGIQPVRERDCLVFEKEGTMAWVDAQTRLPVLWRKGGETRTFQEMAPPSGMIQLSQKAQELSSAFLQARQRLSKPRPRGG